MLHIQRDLANMLGDESVDKTLIPGLCLVYKRIWIYPSVVLVGEPPPSFIRPL